VGWNSEAGRVRETIRKKVISAITFKGCTVRASKEEPQYLIKSDRTDHLAIHKGSALRKFKDKRGARSEETNGRLREREDAKGTTLTAGDDDWSFHAHAR
jgi:hypothetical protein